jgi:opacity protein-like surface antigen
VYGLNAQEAADKKIQAGLIMGTAMNFQTMGTKQFTTNGIGGDFNIGFNMNYAFTPNLGLNTGLEVDFSSVKFEATGVSTTTGAERAIYYRFDDTQILTKGDYEKEPTGSLFELTSRKQTGTYLTVPIMGIFRTKFIGNFRYFGKFGLRNSFLLSNRIQDEGKIWQPDPNDPLALIGNVTTNEGMKASNDLLFIKSSFGLVGGAEYNITGTTCLLAEVGYYYGFTPLYGSPKDQNTHLFTALAPGAPAERHIYNAARQSQLMFKVTVFF